MINRWYVTQFNLLHTNDAYIYRVTAATGSIQVGFKKCFPCKITCVISNINEIKQQHYDNTHGNILYSSVISEHKVTTPLDLNHNHCCNIILYLHIQGNMYGVRLKSWANNLAENTWWHRDSWLFYWADYCPLPLQDGLVLSRQERKFVDN